jgi:hypothetical protein
MFALFTFFRSFFLKKFSFSFFLVGEVKSWVFISFFFFFGWREFAYNQIRGFHVSECFYLLGQSILGTISRISRTVFT